MNIISREYTFCAAHRIEGHPKCGRLHGHNYVVTVFLEGELNAQGMVLDYGEMDKVIKPLIDQFDHRYLVSASNVQAGDFYAVLALGKGDAYAVDCFSTTAENLARSLFEMIQPYIPQLHGIEVLETPKSSATYLKASNA